MIRTEPNQWRYFSLAHRIAHDHLVDFATKPDGSCLWLSQTAVLLSPKLNGAPNHVPRIS